MERVAVPPAILVDASNWEALKADIMAEFEASEVNGFDLETFDEPHKALEDYCREKRKLVFDINRTTIAGFSLYSRGSDRSYYFNLKHSDTDMNIPFASLKDLVDLVTREDKLLIAHNSVFELTMTKMAWDYELGRNDNVVCTMIMAVTAYNPDEYRIEDFQEQRIKPLGVPMPGSEGSLLDMVRKKFLPDAEGNYPQYNLNEDQRRLVGTFTGKTSTSKFSYNGLVNNIKFGYGLKRMVQQFFGHKMQTFKETLGDAKNMGELTGPQTASYGADDAFWAVKIYDHLFQYMVESNPKALQAFFSQENPMAAHYSQMWCNGMVLDQEQVGERVDLERAAMAQILRELKAAIKDALPFDTDPNETLLKHNKIYRNGYERYRKALEDFANSPDDDDDYQMCRQVKSAITKSWALEKGDSPSKGVNLNYYVTMQTILYDLLGLPPQYNQGKLTADKDSRRTLSSAHEDLPVIQTLTKLSGVEQRMSLYLTPYSALMNPDTGKVHPIVSSELATRRLAMKDPNGMQLAKFGDSAYIRGFYLPDTPEHVIISLDWSQVELVLIGEFSGDPEFAACYQSVPYTDVHAVAAAPLAGKLDGVGSYTLEEFKALDRALYKKHRNELGKGSNFEYWYSGGLWTLATKLGLSFEDAKELAARYAEKFHVAEQWRLGVIQDAALWGFVELPDGTRRVRFESTAQWKALMESYFNKGGALKAYGDVCIRKIQKRSGNQAVNAMIQGSCATLAKRSAERIVKKCRELGLRVRFMMPIHDELVWSVHNQDVNAFLTVARKCMTEHPDIVKKLVLDCTASIGNTFRPYNKEKAPFGQIELDELPAEFCITTPEEGRATEEEIQAVVDYLMAARTPTHEAQQPREAS